MALGLPAGWDVGRLREFFNSFEELYNVTISASRKWNFDAQLGLQVRVTAGELKEFAPGETSIERIKSDCDQLEYQLIVAGGGDAGLVRCHEYKGEIYEDSNFHGLILECIVRFWTDFRWLIEINDGLESEVGLGPDSEVDGICHFQELGESIKAFRIPLKREKASLLDRITADLAGILVSENGPSLPGEFVWNGGTFRGLEPTPWRLLDFLWKQPGRLARYSDEMSEFVWRDRNYSCEGSPVKEAARDIRNFFREHSIPLTCSDVASSRVVVVKSAVSEKDTEQTSGEH